MHTVYDQILVRRCHYLGDLEISLLFFYLLLHRVLLVIYATLLSAICKYDVKNVLNVIYGFGGNQIL